MRIQTYILDCSYEFPRTSDSISLSHEAKSAILGVQPALLKEDSSQFNYNTKICILWTLKPNVGEAVPPKMAGKSALMKGYQSEHII